MNISQKKLEKSKGRLEIKIKDQNLQKLYQQGSSKALMPDFHENLKQLMLINTAGGITSGDEYDFKFEIDSSNLCISTQAAEKIYSGFGNPANLEINVNLLNNSNLFTSEKDEKINSLMRSIDNTNHRYGRSTLSVASAGVHKKWNMRRQYSSKIDTADFYCLPTIRA